MSLLYQQEHVRLQRRDQQGATRLANLPVWIDTVHPDALAGVDTATLPTGYLADLYPDIWRWGPSGEQIATQLVVIKPHLDDILAGTTKVTPFFTSFYSLINSFPVQHDQAIISALHIEAATQGTPFPADLMHDIAKPDTTVIEQLVMHPIWKLFPLQKEEFEQFLYRFILIMIYGTFLGYLHRPVADDGLAAHAAFCAQWDL